MRPAGPQVTNYSQPHVSLVVPPAAVPSAYERAAGKRKPGWERTADAELPWEIAQARVGCAMLSMDGLKCLGSDVSVGVGKEGASRGGSTPFPHVHVFICSCVYLHIIIAAAQRMHAADTQDCLLGGPYSTYIHTCMAVVTKYISHDGRACVLVCMSAGLLRIGGGGPILAATRQFVRRATAGQAVSNNTYVPQPPCCRPVSSNVRAYAWRLLSHAATIS